MLAALVYSIVSEVASLVMNWPSIWADSLQPAIVGLEGFLSGLFAGLPDQVSQTAVTALDKLVAWLNEMIPSLLSHAGSAAGSFAFSIPSFAVALVIFVMATYFIASDYPRLRLMVTDRLSPGVRDFFGSVKRTAVAAFGGYVKAQLILSVVIFFILLVGFVVINQPYSVLLAFLLAVLDFIPIVGSGTVIVPWAVADLFLGEYRHAVELMVIWGIIALFRRGAEPKVVGDPDRPVPHPVPHQHLCGHENRRCGGHDSGPGAVHGGHQHRPPGGAGRGALRPAPGRRRPDCHPEKPSCTGNKT